MKLNRKVFAGALALAMGLSAVAPSFAEKTVTTKQDTALVLPTGKVDYTWLKELETKANEVVDLYNKMLEARRVEEAKKADLDALEAELKKAEDDLKAKMEKVEALRAEQRHIWDRMGINWEHFRQIKNRPYTWADFEREYREELDKGNPNFLVVKITEYQNEALNEEEAGHLKELKGNWLKYNELQEEIEKFDVDPYPWRRNDQWREERANIDLLHKRVSAARDDLAKAKKAREIAEEAYDTAVRDFAVDADVRNSINEAFRRGDVTILQRIVTEIKKEPVINETVVNEIVEEVLNDGKTAGTPSEKEETTDVAEKIAELKAAVRKNEIQAAAAKLLMEKNPKAVAPFKADLEKLLATSEALVEKANKAIEKLEKKTSLLVTTAYASEDSEDLDSLINEINDNTQNISDKLDAVEKDAEKEEENKPADDQKPADDNKEEDKKDDNKAPVAKPAGNNAKTGVAGVAGVGAVLAAATAAYVGSKRK